MNIREQLHRAHRMSVSDPDDPARSTTYSRGRDEIDRLTTIIAEAPHGVECTGGPALVIEGNVFRTESPCTCWKSKLDERA